MLLRRHKKEIKVAKKEIVEVKEIKVKKGDK